MTAYKYVKIAETETTETFKREFNPEKFLEKWVRRVKFLDRDDIPMNKYSWPRRVYWTFNFKIHCQWLPRLRGEQLYRYSFSVTLPKDRSKLGKVRTIKEVIS